MTNKILPLENIPKGVIDEIAQYYKTVSYSSYNYPINEKCVTRKLHHKEIIAHNTTTSIVNATTFEISQIHSVDIAQTYLLRGELFGNTTANIYAIYESGTVVYQEEENQNESI